jgi:L-glyceraldehyde 3-phosphate reductase
VGISQYSSKDTARAAEILRAQKTPFLIHQPRYNMMDRWVENGLLNTLEHEGIGSIVFSPLEQGILTDKYLNGIPKDSRAATQGSYLDESQITPEVVKKVQALNEIAQSRNQSLAQMAVAWLLKDKRVTSVLVGASKVSQLEDNIKAIENLEFNKIELEKIEEILKNK